MSSLNPEPSRGGSHAAAKDRPAGVWLAPIGKLLTKTRRVLGVFQVFIRFPAFGFTAMLPLLGVATVAPQLTRQEMLGLIAVAFAFHSFSYVLNDVVDLPVDRTQSLRAETPLVRGAIRHWQALVFALSQAPLALVITVWLEGEGWSYVALGAAFSLMAVYNLWGKRTILPLLTDVIQGVGWGALVLYGASLRPGHLTGLTLNLFAIVVVYIVLVNGVHGSLRDLANDLKWGMRTMATLLGARPRNAVQLAIPRRFVIYAWALQALLVGLLLLPLVQNHFGYTPIAWAITLAAILLLTARCLRLFATILAPNGNRADLVGAIGPYLLASLSGLVALFALYLDHELLAVLLVACIAPLLPQGIPQVIKAVRRLFSRFTPTTTTK